MQKRKYCYIFFLLSCFMLVVLLPAYSQDNLELNKLKLNLIEARELLQTWKLSIAEREKELLEREQFFLTIESNLAQKENSLLLKEASLLERENLLKSKETDYQLNLNRIAELTKSLETVSSILNLYKGQNKILLWTTGILGSIAVLEGCYIFIFKK